LARWNYTRLRGFKLAITSEIIGKLGGADVEVIPVEGVASGGSNSVEVLATIEIPPGESWLIAVIGDMSAYSSSASGTPSLALGDIKTNRYNTQDRMTVAGVHTRSVDVKLARRYGAGSDSFTGHVYTVKM